MRLMRKLTNRQKIYFVTAKRPDITSPVVIQAVEHHYTFLILKELLQCLGFDTNKRIWSVRAGIDKFNPGLDWVLLAGTKKKGKCKPLPQKVLPIVFQTPAGLVIEVIPEGKKTA